MYKHKKTLSTQFVFLSDKPGKPKITLNEADIQASYTKLTWTPPVDNGGNPVLDYRVIVSGAASTRGSGLYGETDRETDNWKELHSDSVC